MVEQLDRVVEGVGALHSQLVLLVGKNEIASSAVLSDYARHRGVTPLNVGGELGSRLAALPVRQRALSAPEVLRELADKHTAEGRLLLGKIELLFDRSLRLDPLDLLKQLARARRVVAVWPGKLQDGRLVYAEMGHPEHQNYGLEGLVPFEVQ